MGFSIWEESLRDYGVGTVGLWVMQSRGFRRFAGILKLTVVLGASVRTRSRFIFEGRV